MVILSNNLIDRINCMSEAPTSVRTNQGEEKDRERDREREEEETTTRVYETIYVNLRWNRLALEPGVGDE